MLNKLDEFVAGIKAEYREVMELKEKLAEESERISAEANNVAAREKGVEKQLAELADIKGRIKSQSELDNLIAEAKNNIASLSVQEKQVRAKQVKKENELAQREADLSGREEELRKSFKRLAEEKENYKKEIIENIAKKM